jgi:hypothetical protein
MLTVDVFSFGNSLANERSLFNQLFVFALRDTWFCHDNTSIDAAHLREAPRSRFADHGKLHHHDVPCRLTAAKRGEENRSGYPSDLAVRGV